MTKSTATYWNTFAPENKQKWSPIAGLEGCLLYTSRAWLMSA